MKLRKTVVITGGTKGIGAEISLKFLKEDWYVLIGARKKSGLANEIHENIQFQEIDVANESDHTELIKLALDWTGSFNCYINSAGFSCWLPLNAVDENTWNEIISINLKGTFWGCKAAAANLSKGGSIINVSSLAGKRGSTNNSLYCASKFGVNGLTQALAKELGEWGIRVNAVCPVYIKTPGLVEALRSSNSPPRGNDIDNFLEDFANSNAALRRLPKGSEVADLCFYLATSQSSAITGQCINVDCGVLTQ